MNGINLELDYLWCWDYQLLTPPMVLNKTHISSDMFLYFKITPESRPFVAVFGEGVNLLHASTQFKYLSLKTVRNSFNLEASQ